MGRQFKEQILWLGRVWEGWTEAERVIATYSVVRNLSPVSTRFLLNLLSHNIQNDEIELATAEARANDPTWVSHIPESCDGGACDLLQHLPLLRPTSGDAKLQYLAVIPKVLAQTLSQPMVHESTLEKARQLLSYSLVHPALSAEERRSLASWIKSFEERLIQSKQSEAFESCSFDPGDEEGDDGGGGSEGERNILETRDKRSRLDDKGSPICTSSPSTDEKNYKTHWNGSPCQLGNDHQQLKDEVRWSYLDAPLSPNNSATSSRSSGSESMTEDCQSTSLHPGMRDIGIWLKSLRLHKYAPLLCNLTYEELLTLNEESLETKGVTKGARHKIVLSVAKLRGRHKQLQTIEEELMTGGSIQTALNHLKSLIITPMLPCQVCNKDQTNTNSSGNCAQVVSTGEDSLTSKPKEGTCISDDRSTPIEGELASSSKVSDIDLPSRFTRVMGKVCTQLLVCVRPEDECVSSFLGLVEKCLNHEAFNVTLTRRLLSWKQQVLRIWHPLPPKAKDSRHVRRWSQQYAGEVLNTSFRSARFTQQRYSTQSTPQMASILAGAVSGKSLHHHFTQPPTGFYSIQPPLSTLMAPRTSLPSPSIGTSASLLSPQHFFAKRPSLQETTSELRPHVTLQRTRSAPSRPNQLLAMSQQSCTIPSPVKTPERTVFPTSPTSTTSLTGSKQTLSSSELHSLHESGPQLGVSHDIIDSDITNRLESLCLSMTEHALG